MPITYHSSQVSCADFYASFTRAQQYGQYTCRYKYLGFERLNDALKLTETSKYHGDCLVAEPLHQTN